MTIKDAVRATVDLALFLIMITVIGEAIHFFYTMGRIDGLW